MLKTLALGAALIASLAHSSVAETVVDLAGRSVVIPHQVDRVILGEGKYLPVLAILDRTDPLKRVAGMMNEFQQYDPLEYDQYLARFPALATIPRLGATSPDSFSVERAIAVHPQVAIFGLAGDGPGPGQTALIQQLQAAGIAVVFVDFLRDPLMNTSRSMTLLGRILGREVEAKQFTDYYKAQLKIVSDRLAGTELDKPSVFLESGVNFSGSCCATMVNGMMGKFVDWAGGTNIAQGLVPGVSGTVSLEYLLSHQPDVYILTAIGNADTVALYPERVALGAEVTPQVARSSLARSLERPGIADLTAVKEGRAFAVWHNF